MKSLEKFLTKLEDGVVFFVCGMAVLASMVYCTINVIGRYVFAHPFEPMRDWVTLLMIVVVFPGLAYAWRQKGIFVNSEFLLVRMKGKLRLWVELFIQLLALFLFAAILVLPNIPEVMGDYTSKKAVGAVGNFVLVWPFKAIMVGGLLLMAIRVIVQISKLSHANVPKTELPIVDQSY